jgi:DNA-binding response OmpR family regulator
MNAVVANRQQILLVDDEEDALVELAESLGDEGFVCFCPTPSRTHCRN